MEKNVICRNAGCKYHQQGDICGTAKEIGADGKCQSFEKGLGYYFGLVWQALQNQNFINTIDLTKDLRIGLYCVMTSYHLGFSEMEWVTCRMIGLRANENGPLLKTEDILAMPIDEDQIQELARKVETGDWPSPEKKTPVKVLQPYGWLSPTGEFTEGDFGNHEEVARRIIYKKNLLMDFVHWKPERPGTGCDFLVDVKGYCLIHDPTGCGGYLVSFTKPQTKAQKNFLYNYFTDMGDRSKAEQFLNAGEQ